MSLPSSGLPIGKESAVVPLEKSFQEFCCYFSMDLILIDFRAKDLGRVIELLLSSFSIKSDRIVIPALKNFVTHEFMSLDMHS